MTTRLVVKGANSFLISFFTSFLDYEDREQIPRNFLDEWEDASDWLHPRYAHLRSGRFS